MNPPLTLAQARMNLHYPLTPAQVESAQAFIDRGIAPLLAGASGHANVRRVLQAAPTDVLQDLRAVAAGMLTTFCGSCVRGDRAALVDHFARAHELPADSRRYAGGLYPADRALLYSLVSDELDVR